MAWGLIWPKAVVWPPWQPLPPNSTNEGGTTGAEKFLLLDTLTHSDNVLIDPHWPYKYQFIAVCTLLLSKFINCWGLFRFYVLWIFIFTLKYHIVLFSSNINWDKSKLNLLFYLPYTGYLLAKELNTLYKVAFLTRARKILRRLKKCRVLFPLQFHRCKLSTENIFNICKCCKIYTVGNRNSFPWQKMFIRVEI